MGFLSKLFSGGAKEIMDGASNILDKTITNEGEKLHAKQQLSEVVFSALNSLQNAQRDIILAETKGNWLQRSWRPLLMLLFGFIVAYAKFIAPAFGLPNAELEPEFWGLLQIGVGGYVVGLTRCRTGSWKDCHVCIALALRLLLPWTLREGARVESCWVVLALLSPTSTPQSLH